MYHSPIKSITFIIPAKQDERTDSPTTELPSRRAMAWAVGCLPQEVGSGWVGFTWAQVVTVGKLWVQILHQPPGPVVKAQE